MRNLSLQQCEQGDSLQALVWAARSGDGEAREELIRRYQPFILKVAAKMSRRYLRPGLDDEIGVAMMGFNEALDCYNLGGKLPFLSFTEIVIRRRLVDYFREQAAHSRELPMTCFESEGEEEHEEPRLPFLAREAEAAYIKAEESIERREEILRFGRILKDFGLNYAMLAAAMPKHNDTRLRLIDISRAVAANDRLMSQIRKRKALPILEVAELSGLSRKTIERHRKYLIALILVMANDLPHLRNYLEP
ncbi:MAG: RNA polymerase sigma-I factor [Bacteroidota bacterium]